MFSCDISRCVPIVTENYQFGVFLLHFKLGAFLLSLHRYTFRPYEKQWYWLNEDWLSSVSYISGKLSPKRICMLVHALTKNIIPQWNQALPFHEANRQVTWNSPDFTSWLFSATKHSYSSNVSIQQLIKKRVCKKINKKTDWNKKYRKRTALSWRQLWWC